MMLDAMRQACSMHCAKQCSEDVLAMHATYATYATNERGPRLGKTSRVPNAPTLVDNRVSRVAEWQKPLDESEVA